MRRDERARAFFGERRVIRRRYEFTASEWDLMRRMLESSYRCQVPHPSEHAALGEIIKKLPPKNL